MIRFLSGNLRKTKRPLRSPRAETSRPQSDGSWEQNPDVDRYSPVIKTEVGATGFTAPRKHRFVVPEDQHRDDADARGAESGA